MEVMEHVTDHNTDVAEGLDNLDEIFTVEGLDGVYVGTVDLSISLGLTDLGNPDNTRLKHALDRILAANAKYNRVAGVHAQTPESAAALSEWGFRLITPANDTKVLCSATKNILEQTRKKIN